MTTVQSPLSEVMFVEHEQLRVTTLQHLVAALTGFSLNADRAEFSRLFDHAQRVLEVDDTYLARLLRVSRPTIGRWARGDSAPHPIVRKPVLTSLADIAENKLQQHRSHNGLAA
jgi:hypothetical protein